MRPADARCRSSRPSDSWQNPTRSAQGPPATPAHRKPCSRPPPTRRRTARADRAGSSTYERRGTAPDRGSSPIVPRCPPWQASYSGTRVSLSGPKPQCAQGIPGNTRRAHQHGPRQHFDPAISVLLIDKNLLGGRQDVVGGLLGAILRQGLGFFSKAGGIQYRGVVLVPE